MNNDCVRRSFSGARKQNTKQKTNPDSYRDKKHKTPSKLPLTNNKQPATSNHLLIKQLTNQLIN